MEKEREEYALVLDFLPRGYASSYRREPIAQAIGEINFTLLELVPKEDAEFKIKDKVYVGEGKWEQVKAVRRLDYTKLTSAAKRELGTIVEELVKKNEDKFIRFFNKAGAITVRQHSLELLPSVGKKHMWDIIDQREKEEFKNFADLKKRVELMPDPVKAISKKIEEELKGKSKYYLFTKPPRPPAMR
jgi:putative nucleotide binding protein